MCHGHAHFLGTRAADSGDSEVEVDMYPRPTVRCGLVSTGFMAKLTTCSATPVQHSQLPQASLLIHQNNHPHSTLHIQLLLTRPESFPWNEERQG